jgi:predicted alpha/beta hydrolase family esterase
LFVNLYYFSRYIFIQWSRVMPHPSMFADQPPLIITVPGLHSSGPDHWQTIWERSRDRIVRAELGNWDAPDRDDWVAGLDQVIRAAGGPVVLVAHSLGCHAVAWWVASGSAVRVQVAGALLVAPPDVDHAGAIDEICSFAPTPQRVLPFPSTVVASLDDPYATVEQTFEMAQHWGSTFVTVGRSGHINAESGLGRWSRGEALLDELIIRARKQSFHGSGFIDREQPLAASRYGLAVDGTAE